MTPARSVRVFGDTAVVVDTATVGEAHALAATLATLDPVGVEDVIVGFRSVTVVADPDTCDMAALGVELASVTPASPDSSTVDLVEVPAALDGTDLDEVARLARLSPSRVVDLLAGTDLHVAFVGFAPGFAYLVGLPDELASVPRRATPRAVVPGGSVALAGGFAGIYPQASPGGWQLVGRTAVSLFDPDLPPYSVLRAGATVRLRPGDVPDIGDPARSSGRRRSLQSTAPRRLRIEDPGLLSFVQDRGRVGVAGLGVPRAGAADPDALRIANRLVGNDEHAAAIETTARGPTVRFTAAAHVAVVGSADVRVDGHEVPGDAVVPVGADQTLTSGPARTGLRSYIAVDGGIDIPPVLGSRSSDVLCGLGPGRLVKGDIIGLGSPGHPRGPGRAGVTGPAVPTLGVIMGPDPFPPRRNATCCRPSGRSDRPATGSASAWVADRLWTVPVLAWRREGW